MGARKPAARPVRHRSASWAGLLGTLCDFAGEHTPFSLSLRSLKPERLEKELDRFADRAQQAAGRRVGLAAFAAYLEVPVSDTLGDMFSLFDEVARPPGPGLGVGGWEKLHRLQVYVFLAVRRPLGGVGRWGHPRPRAVAPSGRGLPPVTFDVGVNVCW